VEKCSSTPFSKYWADLKAANLIRRDMNSSMFCLHMFSSGDVIEAEAQHDGWDGTNWNILAPIIWYDGFLLLSRHLWLCSLWIFVLTAFVLNPVWILYPNVCILVKKCFSGCILSIQRKTTFLLSEKQSLV
jgi:hypothetical protein